MTAQLAAAETRAKEAEAKVEQSLAQVTILEDKVAQAENNLAAQGEAHKAKAERWRKEKNDMITQVGTSAHDSMRKGRVPCRFERCACAHWCQMTDLQESLKAREQELAQAKLRNRGLVRKATSTARTTTYRPLQDSPAHHRCVRALPFIIA